MCLLSLGFLCTLPLQDVVLLQEVWVDADAQALIRAGHAAGLTHATHFRCACATMMLFLVSCTALKHCFAAKPWGVSAYSQRRTLGSAAVAKSPSVCSVLATPQTLPLPPLLLLHTAPLRAADLACLGRAW
jgi:hypothetical protein